MSDPYLWVALAGILAISLAQAAAGDKTPPRAARPIPFAEEYEARVHAGLPYRLLKPKHYDPEQSYPLVLFLHGAGERGSDNRMQLANGVSEFFANEKTRAQYPCFVVLPQCPADDVWANLDATARGLSRSARAALELIAALRKEFNIDATRLYIGGLSLGGFGTWHIVAARPRLFAAAFPICGGGNPATAPRLAHLPLWTFHGAQDDVVPAERSRAMIRAVKQAGGHPKYTEYPGVGHDAWTHAFSEPELLAWLFAQRRPAGRAAPARRGAS